MKEEYHLFPLTDWHRTAEVQEVFRQGLAETSEAYWNWKYREENGLPERTLLVGENRRGELVALAGLQPLDYKEGEHLLRMVQIQDLIILPQCRGTGLMRKLYFFAMEYCKENGCDGFVQHPNEKSFYPFLKYGATNMGSIGSIASKKRLLPFLGRPVYQQCAGDWQLNISDRMPEDIFFEESIEVYRLIKSAAFMRWRFDKNPEDDFRWLTIRKDGVLRGYMVFQAFHGRLRTAINIYDFEIGKDVPADILKQSIRMLSSHGSWVSLWGRLSKKEYSMWAEAGLNVREEGRAHFTLHPFGDQIIPENWHLTRADLDF